MFIKALYLIAKKVKTIQLYVHTMGYYAAIKGDKVLMHATT